MEDIINENENERYIENCPKTITLKSTEKIIEQMKNNVCKINLRNGIKATGFFCKILYNNNELPVLITNNHVINKEVLDKNETILIVINNEEKEIELNNRIKYTNKEYDITIIEIKEQKDKINNFLEIDDNIIQNKSNISYIKESIYVIQYEGDKKEVSVSYGIIQGIDEINNYTFKHLCSTDKGSSGAPILNISNNKVIGIHKQASYHNNRGTFLNYAIQDFIKQNNNTNVLKEFNTKYNLKILDINITELDLGHMFIGNDGLELLSKINFKNLTKLYLDNNNISVIKIFEKEIFEQLEILNLGSNNISDINILEKVKFNNLKGLYLDNNNIPDIKILEKVNFNQLEVLDLSYNKISDINILKNVNFKNLKKLYLNHNNISDITILEKLKFEQLEILYLYNNKISDINILKKVNFKNYPNFKNLKKLKLIKTI